MKVETYLLLHLGDVTLKTADAMEFSRLCEIPRLSATLSGKKMFQEIKSGTSQALIL